jgi:asparagine synthase (glutamine-hydrolysing)
LCGIAGFTHRKRAAPAGRMREVITTLAHRGPDHQGVFESNTVSLGAARLKIIDLSTGDQPMTSADGGTTIAFNGEIYNHLDLRRELEALGHRFRSRTDTETVLEAFREWDTGCFGRMRGMFAVALWTEASRRLVLGRDRLGIKPLYVVHRSAGDNEDLYFGSELKALFVHPEIDRRLSLAGLDSYLSLNYCAGSATLVEGIEKLSPGHWLEWRDGKIHEESYWQLPLGEAGASTQTRHWTLPAAQEELDRLLKLSVKEHLASDVPVGVWLSGGVDSSTLLHYAAEASSSRVKTFSISFRGHSFDESGYIRRATEHYGTEHQQLDLNPEQDLTGAIEKFAYYSDEPNADAGALPVWFLSGLTKSSATVALSGEGADELFGGYLTQRASLLARNVRHLSGPVLRLARQAAKLWPVSDEKIGFDYKLKRFLEGCQMPALRAHAYWGGTFSDSEKQRLIKPALPGTLAGILGQFAAAEDDLSTYLGFDQKYYLPDDILTKVDRMSMAHALEVRPPFLDHRIVEFANTVPSQMKIDGSRQKILLKTLMRGKLPPEILTRKKIGFDIPAHEWFRGPLRPLLREALDYARAEHAGFFRMVEIETLVRAHLERRANLGYHLWGLMILFLWMKKWGIQTGAPVQPAFRKMENAFHSIS